MTSSGSPSVLTLREAARQAVERDSLRSVAAQIGMSPMGLSHFLEGGQPYKPTLRKLRHWFIQHGASLPSFEAEARRAAVHALLESYPAAVQRELYPRVLRLLEQAHRPVPPWLAQLLRELHDQ